MKLTEQEIKDYIEHTINTYNVEGELRWMIENHLDDEGLKTIKEVVSAINEE